MPQDKSVCKTCMNCDHRNDENSLVAICHHPKNERGGAHNFNWMIDECINKDMQYWAPLLVLLVPEAREADNNQKR